MIVIRIEMWPGGDRSRATDLGTAVIANDSELADMSAYEVRLCKGAAYSSRPGEVWRGGRVEAFPRKDKRWGPWELLALALEAAVGDRIASLKRYIIEQRAKPSVELLPWPDEQSQKEPRQ